MERGLININSATTTTLIDFDSDISVSSINISNNNSSNEVIISLFKHDGTTSNDAYIIKNLIIPVGVSLVLTDHINIDSSVLSLKITTEGTSPNVSVMIK
tara:strand:- start:925 stop:1224 length:300 start_codon:yes stop_codon:yes gene_type:complete